MKNIDITFSIESKGSYVCRNITVNDKVYEALSSNIKVYDVSTYLFVPDIWDFWDDETKMLIPNYIKRKKTIRLKTHDEVINWNYFICANKNSDIAYVVKYLNKNTDEDRYNISILADNPKFKLDLLNDK